MICHGFGAGQKLSSHHVGMLGKGVKMLKAGFNDKTQL